MFNLFIYVTVVVIIASLSDTDAKVCECKCRTQSVCQSIPNGDKITADIKKAITTEIKKEVDTLKQDLIAAQTKLIQNTTPNHKLKGLFKPQKPSKLFLVQNAKGRDCSALYKKGIHADGLYHIKPFQSGPKAGHSVLAYCDMTTEGGGWTVFQRRRNGHLDFYRNWIAYKSGFGNPGGEHWLGNDVLHALTASPQSELRVELEALSGKKDYAKYSVFSVGDVKNKYRLRVAGYSGTAGDSLSYNNKKFFTTYDHDNDPQNTKNCAVRDHGAWWYENCTFANLNGRYNKKGVAKNEAAVIWRKKKNRNISFMKTEMKVRSGYFRR